MRIRQEEQGGIGVFVVVGALLTALLVGGLFIAKQQGKQAYDTAGQSTAQNQSTTTTSTAADDSASDSDDQTIDGGSATSETSQTTETTASTSSSNSTPEQSSHVAVTGPSDDGGATPGNVPSTGPEDTLAIVAVLSLGVVGTMSYVRSRRSFHASALK